MTPLRTGFVIAGLASFVLAIGFINQASWATDLSPWEATPLSYIFIASILVAIASPVLWIAVTGELAAMQAGAIDLAITYGGATIYLVTLVGDAGQPSLGPYVAVFGIGFLAMVITFARLRLSVAAVAVMLVGAGTALVFQADIFPWALGDETSVMFGLIYLGAAAYFIWGFLSPAWPNAAGQLIGFLAYDLVLIGPFVDQFSNVSGGQLTSLIVYTVFVIYSGTLAVHYLFLAEATRLRIS